MCLASGRIVANLAINPHQKVPSMPRVNPQVHGRAPATNPLTGMAQEELMWQSGDEFCKTRRAASRNCAEPHPAETCSSYPLQYAGKKEYLNPPEK